MLEFSTLTAACSVPIDGLVGGTRRECEGPCAKEISVFWRALVAKVFLSWSAMEPKSVIFHHTHIKNCHVVGCFWQDGLEVLLAKRFLRAFGRMFIGVITKRFFLMRLQKWLYAFIMLIKNSQMQQWYGHILFEQLYEDPTFKPSGVRFGENDMDYDIDERSMAANYTRVYCFESLDEIFQRLKQHPSRDHNNEYGYGGNDEDMKFRVIQNSIGHVHNRNPNSNLVLSYQFSVS